MVSENLGGSLGILIMDGGDWALVRFGRKWRVGIGGSLVDSRVLASIVLPGEVEGVKVI